MRARARPSRGLPAYVIGQLPTTCGSHRCVRLVKWSWKWSSVSSSQMMRPAGAPPTRARPPVPDRTAPDGVVGELHGLGKSEQVRLQRPFEIISDSDVVVQHDAVRVVGTPGRACRIVCKSTTCGGRAKSREPIHRQRSILPPFLRRRPAPRDLAQERFELEFAQPQAHADIVAVKHVDVVLARRVEHVPPRVTRQQLACVFDATLLVHHECDCVQ